MTSKPTYITSYANPNLRYANPLHATLDTTKRSVSKKQMHQGTEPKNTVSQSHNKKLMLRRCLPLFAAMNTKNFSIQKGSTVPIYLAGRAVEPNADLAVENKYNGEEFCRVALADKEMIERATDVAATTGRESMRRLPAYQRQQILQNVVDRAKERREEFGYYLAIEAGKPIKDARGEADRLIQVSSWTQKSGVASTDFACSPFSQIHTDLPARGGGINENLRRVR